MPVVAAVVRVGVMRAPFGALAFALAATALLTVEHLVATVHHALSERPRSPVLSFAGGVGTAFVLLRLLPQVGDGEPQVTSMLAGGPLAWVMHPAFTLAVLSLLIFFALLRLMQRERRASEREGSSRHTSPGAFWLHAPIYAVLNVVIGLLVLQQGEEGWRAVLLFVTAKGSALLVLDHAFFDQHGGRYTHIGRWMAAVAIPVGAALRLGAVLLRAPRSSRRGARA